MTVETNTVVPLCPQISASTEADNGWMKRMEMEKSSRTERKTRTRSDGSRILTCRWDGVLWRLVRSEEWCRKCMWVEISCSMGLTRFLRSCFLSPSAPRAGILPLPPPPAGSLISSRSQIVHVHPPPPSCFLLSCQSLFIVFWSLHVTFSFACSYITP